MKVRSYDVQIHSSFVGEEMPDVVIEIQNVHRSVNLDGQPGYKAYGNMFAYNEKFYQLISSRLDFLKTHEDINLIGTDYEYYRDKGGHGRYIFKSTSLINLEEYKYYIGDNSPESELLYRLRLYFRFDIPE